MANNNTCYKSGGVSQTNPTAETAFPSATGGTARLVVGIPPYETAAQLPAIASVVIPGTVFDGVPFRVTATFKVKGGAAGNFTGKLYWNSGANSGLTAFTGDALIMASAAVPTAGANIAVSLRARCFWDSASQQLMATALEVLSNIGTPTFAGEAAASTIPVATSLATTDKLQFFATALFGTSNAGNVATLVELSITQE